MKHIVRTLLELAAHSGPILRPRNLGPVAVLVAALVAPTGRAQAQTFFDGTFGGTWTSTKIVDTTPGQSATFTSVTQSSGGNPGDYRDTAHTFGLGAIIVAHMNSAAVVDPSLVSVQSISFSYDLNYFDEQTVGGAVAYRLALLQAGSYYSTGNDNIFTNAWTPFSHSGLHASDFALVAGGGPPTPDLSNTGAPITLGFMSANSQGGSTPITKESGIDNWSVLIAEVTTFCVGDGTGSLSCPCANGALGHGCPNSDHLDGALLTWAGVASLTSDNFTLTSTQAGQTGHHSSSLAMMMQGDDHGLYHIYGGGLRCIENPLRRLYIFTPANTVTLTAPSASSIPPNVPISTRASALGDTLLPGSVRGYQLLYRDPASTCNNTTFNSTNGVLVTWAP
jgi:hypothetical protein